MFGERENYPVEILDSKVEKSWFVIVELLSRAVQKQKSVELYAFDSEDPTAFKREQGDGQLKLSVNGDLQIKQGKNWLLIKQLPIKLREHLCLDEPSARALRVYYEEKTKERPYRSPPVEAGSGRVESRVGYNEREIKRFRLEKLDLPAYPVADKLIARLLKSNQHKLGYIDITDDKPGGGQEQFCRVWRKAYGELPLPCVPPLTLFKQLNPGKLFPIGVDEDSGDFWYLDALAEGHIVKNIGGDISNTAAPVLPRFGEAETIFAMDWVEKNFDDVQAGQAILRSSPYSQPLFKELGIKEEGVTNIPPGTVDEKLWEGDPGKRKQTKQHRAIIRQLGFNPDELEFHFIRQDQYARLAKLKQWGQHDLHTCYEHYFLDEDGVRQGLGGGARELGGASNVEHFRRNKARLDLAVRLVLSPRRK